MLVVLMYMMETYAELFIHNIKQPKDICVIVSGT